MQRRRRTRRRRRTKRPQEESKSMGARHGNRVVQALGRFSTNPTHLHPNEKRRGSLFFRHVIFPFLHLSFFVLNPVFYLLFSIDYLPYEYILIFFKSNSFFNPAG